jgi:hypothetical protein
MVGLGNCDSGSGDFIIGGKMWLLLFKGGFFYWILRFMDVLD